MRPAITFLNIQLSNSRVADLTFLFHTTLFIPFFFSPFFIIQAPHKFVK